MPIIEVKDLCLSFGAQPILCFVSFSLHSGDKVGIVGSNGAGKTTLLRLLSGEIKPDQGHITYASRLSVGYLPQIMPGFTGLLFNEAMAGRQDILEMREKMGELERLMEKTAGFENKRLSPETHVQPCQGTISGLDPNLLLQEYSRVQNRFEALGGYDLEHETARVLSGLGLPRELWYQNAQILSGGQKMRLALARVLLSRPDVLLLDEPTNHLDIAGVEWLESYLKKYKGAVMVVSHDRRFLDNLADKIFELEDGKVTVYRGNFSAYLSQKEEALRRQEELFREQQELIQRTRAFIQKWKANANRTGQAKSREKMLERLEMIEKPKSEKKLKMKLTFEDFPGRDVLRIDALSPCFNGEQSGQVKLFEDFSCLIQRGERVALVGPNGCGKTTFLECIQGLKSFEGEVKWGSGVVIGYLPQETLFPSREEKVIDEIKSMGLQEREARDILGRFLFSGDDVEKKVGDLSGGEKKRLHLAKLVLSGANVLLLDEPTNHLDIASREALEKAVLDFGGTCIFASHDRYLIDKIATRIFFFKDGRIIDFRGNYSLFLEREESTRGSSRGETQVAEISRNPRNKNKMEKKSACDPSGTDRQILQGYLQDIESKIFALESREKELIALLSDSRTYMNDSSLSDSPENVRPGSGASDVGSLLAEYAEIKESLEHLYAEWEKLVEESSDEPGEV